MTEIPIEELTAWFEAWYFRRQMVVPAGLQDDLREWLRGHSDSAGLQGLLFQMEVEQRQRRHIEISEESLALQRQATESQLQTNAVHEVAVARQVEASERLAEAVERTVAALGQLTERLAEAGEGIVAVLGQLALPQERRRF